MTQLDILYTIVVCLLLLIVGTNGIFNLVKWIKGKKYDESEYKTRCKLLAEILRAGIEVPTMFIVKVLEGKVSNITFAETINDLKDLNKHSKKKGK